MKFWQAVMFFDLIKTLKINVSIVILVTWNVMMAIIINLNDGIEYIQTPSALILMTITCGSFLAFFLATTFIPSWQHVILRSQANPKQAIPGLLFLSFIVSIPFLFGIIKLIRMFLIA